MLTCSFALTSDELVSKIPKAVFCFLCFLILICSERMLNILFIGFNILSFQQQYGALTFGPAERDLVVWAEVVTGKASRDDEMPEKHRGGRQKVDFPED